MYGADDDGDLRVLDRTNSTEGSIDSNIRSGLILFTPFMSACVCVLLVRVYELVSVLYDCV